MVIACSFERPSFFVTLLLKRDGGRYKHKCYNGALDRWNRWYRQALTLAPLIVAFLSVLHVYGQSPLLRAFFCCRPLLVLCFEFVISAPLVEGNGYDVILMTYRFMTGRVDVVDLSYAGALVDISAAISHVMCS